MIELSLLGTFAWRVGGRVLEATAIGSQRLVALLAVRDHAVDRSDLIRTIWPAASVARGSSSLRTTISRLEAPVRDALEVTAAGLGLDRGVAVDLRESRALADRLIQSGAAPPPTVADVSPAAISALSVELLPDWYDDWAVREAEDWRQLRIRGLEAQARLLTAEGRLPEAGRAARAAMRAEPLRETPHVILVRVYLAAGNQSDALGVYDRYRALLHTELGLEPTPVLTALVDGIGSR